MQRLKKHRAPIGIGRGESLNGKNYSASEGLELKEDILLLH
jgi:hypothetical protein